MKVKVHKKDLSKMRALTYDDMEDTYFNLLDRNFCIDAEVNGLELKVYGLTDLEAVAINLGNTILHIFPANLIQEDKEYIRNVCVTAAMFCIVAGDRIYGPEKNPFRKDNDRWEYALTVLSDYLFDTVCDRAEQLRSL